MMILKPVSYTHLDVYKRQVGTRMGEYLYEKVFRPLDMGWPLWEHDPPVSYTHLDVYKRQV